MLYELSGLQQQRVEIFLPFGSCKSTAGLLVGILFVPEKCGKYGQTYANKPFGVNLLIKLRFDSADFLMIESIYVFLFYFTIIPNITFILISRCSL